MSRRIRRIGVWLISAAWVSCPLVWGQNSATGTGSRRPAFAKPETPRQIERIRFFDVKHIKAELAIDTQNHRLSGVVTHTLSPLHPHLTQLELDCGPDLKVAKVTVGRPGEAVLVRDQERQALDHARHGLRFERNDRRGDRVRRITVTRALLCRAGDSVPEEDAVLLDPGRIRGHALLASLLRLPERARHQRNDHHRAQAPFRSVQRRAGPDQAG